MSEKPPSTEEQQITKLAVKLGKNKYWQAKDAKKIIGYWQRSGESRSAFARRYNLPAHRLSYWQLKTQKVKISTGQQPGSQELAIFPAAVSSAPIKLIADDDKGNGSIEITTPSGLRIKLADNFKSSTLRRLFEVIPC